MSAAMESVLKHKVVNGWPLFWLIAVPMTALMVIEMLATDTSVPAGVSQMIGYSVRWAVPFIFVVVASSALATLFPGSFTHWLLRNRKFIGMCFAVAMAWQGFFIYLMSSFHREYYFEEIFFFRDELEGSTGYLFLAAMVVTSFSIGRRLLNARQWKLLHRSGVYFLWAYPLSTYWWTLSYDGNPQTHDYVFYWAGITAFLMRIVAWGKRRWPLDGVMLSRQMVGGAVIGLGLYWTAGSLYYQNAVTGFLTAYPWSANLELWLPFWPFEPFLSVFLVGIGMTVLTSRMDAATVSDQVPAQ